MITFPSNPTIGQLHEVGGRSFRFNGTGWVVSAIPGGVVTQTTGQSIVDVMSQKAVTDALVTVQGTIDHNQLTVESRSLPDQHPIDAISGLTTELAQLETKDVNLQHQIFEIIENSPIDIVRFFTRAQTTLSGQTVYLSSETKGANAAFNITQSVTGTDRATANVIAKFAGDTPLTVTRELPAQNTSLFLRLNKNNTTRNVFVYVEFYDYSATGVLTLKGTTSDFEIRSDVDVYNLLLQIEAYIAQIGAVSWIEIKSYQTGSGTAAQTTLVIEGDYYSRFQYRIPAGGVSSWVDLSDKPVWLNYATQAAFEGGHGHAWTQITGKPATFTPAAHTHLWADLTDKPVTFAPSAHNHAQEDITSTSGWITTALAGKASTAVATTTVNGLMAYADKVKLNGIATGANNYTHPANHPASIITQDVNRQFVSQDEKNSWNQIVDLQLAGYGIDGLMSASDKDKLDGIAENANNYIHPTNHPASIVTQDANNRFVTDTLITAWNGKANAAHTHAQADIDSAAGWISTALAGKQAAGSYLTTPSIELLNASGVMQYRFTTSGTDCLIANAAGTTIGKIDQSGNLMMKGGIACYATI